MRQSQFADMVASEVAGRLTSGSPEHAMSPQIANAIASVVARMLGGAVGPSSLAVATNASVIANAVAARLGAPVGYGFPSVPVSASAIASLIADRLGGRAVAPSLTASAIADAVVQRLSLRGPVTHGASPLAASIASAVTQSLHSVRSRRLRPAEVDRLIDAISAAVHSAVGAAEKGSDLVESHRENLGGADAE